MTARADSQPSRRTLFGLLAAILGGQPAAGAAGATAPVAPALPAVDERRRSCFVFDADAALLPVSPVDAGELYRAMFNRAAAEAAARVAARARRSDRPDEPGLPVR